ncbi:MAG: membrane protein insertase YidC [Chitinivibrionia bacterium]|nr:membrane protein insertase YidC [Chitinivibrionia bacterium]
MKKETLLGFAILIAGFWFFNSPHYYRLIGQPFPFDAQTQQAEAQQTQQNLIDELRAQADIVVRQEQERALLYISESSDDEYADSVEVIAPPRQIILENNVLRLTIDEIGARITSAQALDFTYGRGHKREGETVEIISDTNIGIMTTAIGPNDLSRTRFFFDEEESNESRAIFTSLLNGETVRKVFELNENSHLVNFRKQSDLLAQQASFVALKGGVAESESDDDRSPPFSERYITIASDGNKIERLTVGRAETRERSGLFDWVALNSKYFMFALIPHDRVNRDLTISSFVINERAKVEGININYAFEFGKNPPRGANLRDDNYVEYTVFIGPSRHSYLTEAGVGLERTLFRGYGWFFRADLWFPPLCEGVLWFLNFFGKLVGDYGISILLLTLLLKIVTFPLSQASINSMAAMQVLQPKIQDIQKKYKDNKQLQQQKILELYQSEGINPLASLGGCIPLLVQMPIMIALFIVLRKAVELRGETTFFLPWVHDLSSAEVLFRLPFTIPFYGDNFAILPIAMAGLMFVQNKMTIKDPNQIAMVYLMPVIMLVMFNNFPAGLTLYFGFSSLLQIIQQKFFVKKPVVSQAVVVDTTKGKKK